MHKCMRTIYNKINLRKLQSAENEDINKSNIRYKVFFYLFILLCVKFPRKLRAFPNKKFKTKAIIFIKYANRILFVYNQK